MAESPPNWTRDELILALDLYFQIEASRGRVSVYDERVRELSELLKALPIHLPTKRVGNFRNPASVSMKLSNFQRLDPNYTGVGLKRGAVLDEVVWDEFARDRDYLTDSAAAIRENAARLSAKGVERIETSKDDGFPEGRVLESEHKRHERNSTVVKRKKQEVLAERGKLDCEVCGFDFEAVYGDRGHGFAECHHLKPLSDLRHGARTRTRDLAIVCANCHRMIHRKPPMLSIDELKACVGEKAYP